MNLHDLISVELSYLFCYRQDNWWKKRTKLEKQLSCISLGMIFLSLVLLISLFFYGQYGVPKGVCLTSGCVHAASHVLERLNEQVDPCEDFYAFACGGFIENKTIPDEALAYNSFMEVGEMVMKQLRTILQEPIRPSDIHPVRIAKTYYNACMNEEIVNQESLIDAQTLLNSLGGWPVLEEIWFPSYFDWIDQLKLFKDKGFDFNFLLSISAGKDFGDSSRRIINIDQPAVFGLSSHILKKGKHDTTVKAYLQLMVDFAVMFGANDFKASEELEEVLNFEIKLSQKTVSKIDNRNTSYFYNKMTLKQLKQHYGSIDWITLLTNILPEEAKLYDEKEILVEVPSYIDALEKMLKITQPKTVANYLYWRAVLQIWPFLPQRFADRIMKFKKLLNGVSQIPPRWNKCLDLVKQHTSVMLATAYIRKYSSRDVKNIASEIIKYIIAAFKRTIQDETVWMDGITKARALEKADSLITHVAYAEELLDDETLEDMYSDIHVNERMFLQSYLNINKHEWNRLLHRLLEQVRRDDWRETSEPTTINAFYYLLENSMILPAAILQGIFFNKNRPGYLNYGAIGSIVGHEIVHAFDDQGSQFDKDGNLRNWWEEETKEAFVEKTKCFIQKFNNMRVIEIGQNVSGERTLGENIADNGGTKQAYLAYEEWVKNNGEEYKLPGLKYTPKQLFWIAGAQNWCSKERLDSLKHKVAVDSHAPDKYRVNGNYENIDFFAKDFSCTPGSKMNPQNKCSIW
ncbi:hypothetical protein HHI36_006553 [Cryptolaemus montrouzieri]|uniref:Neprilysin n=1 Tax=Cryptolaemus montrouzieri TaxID=559131 RepID=A0ABD2NXF0_9CUCU